ncbi:unnamed protein product [Cunninghamella blakesleeana]
MAGVLVMCTRGREQRAVKEAINLFNQYADELYPETKTDNKEVEEEKDVKEDIEDSIAKELAELKESKSKSSVKKRFTYIATGTDCLVFIKTCDEIEPSKFIHDILIDMQEKQVKKTRYISRLLPVQKTCHANLPEIEREAKLVISPQFSAMKDENDNIISKSFSVNARIRNCSKIDRMEVTKAFASAVGLPHKVDLKEPDYVIIVEICQTICMMSVVSDFGKLRKYNLESLLGLNDPQPIRKLQDNNNNVSTSHTNPTESIKEKENETTTITPKSTEERTTESIKNQENNEVIQPLNSESTQDEAS